MSKLIVKQVFDLYEQNYEHKHEAAAFDYNSFQAIIKVDELLETLGIESVWHFDGPVELFGKYKHLLDMKEVDSYPPSRNGPQS
jgi:hypothetical protein